MRQIAPDPILLASLVSRLKYKRGWVFSLADLDRDQGSEGLTLEIVVTAPDSYNPDQNLSVIHRMIVPAAAYDERAWCRWLLDQIILVEQHETCEFFQIDDHRVYAPNHGPGRNPYPITDQGFREDAQTTFRGAKFVLDDYMEGAGL